MAINDLKNKIEDKKHQHYLERQCKKAQKNFMAYFLDEKNKKEIEITNENGEKEKVELYQLHTAHDIYLPDEMSALGNETFTDYKVAKTLDAVAWMDKESFNMLEKSLANREVDILKPTIYSLREGEYPTIIKSFVKSGIITGNAYIENSELTTAIVNNNIKIKDSNIVCSKILKNATITNGSVIFSSVVTDDVVCDKSRVEFCNMYDNVKAEESTLTYSTFTENVQFKKSYIRPMKVAKKEWYGGDGVFNEIGDIKGRNAGYIDGPDVDPEEMAEYGFKPYEVDGKKIYVSDNSIWFYYHLLYKDSGVEELKITEKEIFNSERTKKVLENIYIRVSEGEAQIKDIEELKEISKIDILDYKDRREKLKEFKEKESKRKDEFNKDIKESEESSLEYFKNNHPKDKSDDNRKTYNQPSAVSVKIDLDMLK